MRESPVARWRAALVGVVMLVVLGGCSGAASSPAPGVAPGPGSTPAPTPPPELVACPDAARRIVAGTAGGAAVRIVVDRTRGLTTCDYRPRGPRSSAVRDGLSCSGARLTVNTAPQAYVDFHRFVDEQVQNASIGGPGHAPVAIHAPEVGPEVDWIPALQTLQAGRPGRWITVVMDCDRTAPARDVARRLAATVR